MKRPLGLSSPPSDHSVSEPLSTCQLGARVNDRLALGQVVVVGGWKWEGTSERTRESFVVCILSCATPSRYSYPGVREEVGAREDRGESSSPNTSYKFTGHDWVMGFQPSQFCFYTPKLVHDNKQGEASMGAHTHKGDLRPTHLIIMWTSKSASGIKAP